MQLNMEDAPAKFPLLYNSYLEYWYSVSLLYLFTSPQMIDTPSSVDTTYVWKNTDNKHAPKGWRQHGSIVDIDSF